MTVVYKLISAAGDPITVKAPNGQATPSADAVPNVRCPHCMHMGAFTKAIPNDLTVQHIEKRGGAPFEKGRSIIGIRICPNSECKGVVLAVIDKEGKAIVLPSEVLDFDSTDIPPPIAASLEEAIKCHSAQCYKAAALMVRRVLEELCEERGAVGDNLKKRIEALSKIIIVPQDLLQAADHLRLLGNDAAHIEAKTYQTIGEAEVRLSIDLTKELLKGAYQYKGLLSRLTALQKP
ncbi:MAG: DUF4145 domain-containing protein [Hyphomonadaceae bacterium]|nr:DUF4145 domain-containing protein [Hyphomonadaceae bacterium]